MRSNSESEVSRVAKIKSNKCKLVRSSKPLVNYKFYLDIEKHNISQKIESKIKELGGSIEFFLTKEVTHFVTDKSVEEVPSNFLGSPQTSQAPGTSNYSEISLHNPNGTNINYNEVKGKNKIKSRADAMLHRARKSINSTNLEKVISTQKDPREIARPLNTPIWTTEHTVRFLEKVCAGIKAHCSNNNALPKSKQRSRHAKTLNGDFIKIESFSRKYRPYYRELTIWPIIDLNATEHSAAFRYSHEDKNPFQQLNVPENSDLKIQSNSTMTRKSRSKAIRVKQSAKLSSEKQCGFCEICRVEYDVLTIHLKTDEHLNFAKNDQKFIALDSLIKSGANVDRFLSLNSNNKSCTDNNCETFNRRCSKRGNNNNKTIDTDFDIIPPQDIDDSAVAEDEIFPRHTRQSHIKLNSNIQDFTKESHTGIGILRARRASVRKINYAEPKEDEENSNDTILETPKKKKINKLKDSWDSPIAVFKTAASKLLYKVVDSPKQEIDKVPSEFKEPPCTPHKSPKKPSPLIVKFKKIRQAELSLLSDEAENFMFPKKISEISTDIDRQTTSEPCSVSSEIISSDKIEDKSSSDKIKKLANTKAELKPVLSRIDTEEKMEIKSNESLEEIENSIIDSQTDAEGKLKELVDVKIEPVDEDDNIINVVETRRRTVVKKEHEITYSQIETRKSKATLTAVEQSHSTRNHSEIDYRRSYKRRKSKLENDELLETSTPRGKRMFLTAPIQPSGKKTNGKRIIVNKNIPNDNCSPGDGMGEICKVDIAEALKSNEISQQKFAFERIPSTEPWYDVFQRQDECKERMFEYYGSTVYRRLPYEMGPLPPLPPNCCVLNQKENIEEKQNLKVNKQISEPDKPVKDEGTEMEDKIEDTVSSEVPIIPKKTIKDKNVSKTATLMSLEMPRKSPREHASTLAILSCLIQKREEKHPPPPKVEVKDVEEEVVNNEKLQNNYKSSSDYGNVFPQISENVKRLKRGENLLKKRLAREERTNNPTMINSGKHRYKKNVKTVEKETNKTKVISRETPEKVPYFDSKNLKRQIDEYLSQPISDSPDLDDVPISSEECQVNFSNDHLDLADLVREEILNEYVVKRYNSAAINRLRLFTMFSINKKRKNNRTGWPKKKKLTFSQRQQHNNSKISRVNGMTKVGSNCDCIKSENEINVPTQSPITPPETDPDEKLDSDVVSLSCRDENTNMSCMSASDKAENSDIFTVSSDSMDTLLDINNSNKNEHREDSQSQESEIQVDHDVTINVPSVIVQENGIDKLKTKVEAKAKKRRKNIFNSKKYSNSKRKQMLKILASKNMHVKNSLILSSAQLSPPPSEVTNGSQIIEITEKLKTSSETMTCPQLSPRKLRAPRGRWYRER